APRIAFVFSGTNDFSLDAKDDLAADFPLYKAELDHLRSTIAGISGSPPTDWSSDIRLFLSQYAVSQALINLGISPVAVVGHGTGEYAAACTAGYISTDGALNLLHQRDKLVDTLNVTPATLRAFADRQTLAEILPSDGQASVVAEDGQKECLISGTAAAVELVQQRLADGRIAFQ